jgi:hypothetical protein
MTKYVKNFTNPEKILNTKPRTQKKAFRIALLTAVSILFLMLLIIFIPRISSKQSYSITSKNITVNNENFRIEIEYPYISSFITTPGYREFNRLVKSFTDREIDNFTTTSELYHREESQYENARQWELIHRYNIKYQSDEFISVVFEGLEYTGGAHQNYIFKTILFDLKRGKEVQLIELFLNDSQYLERISRLSVKELLRRELPEITVLGPGSEPVPENFSLFYVDEEGLSIIFPPYRVASFADGPQKVMIPYDMLEDIIDKDGPAGKIRVD